MINIQFRGTHIVLPANSQQEKFQQSQLFRQFQQPDGSVTTPNGSIFIRSTGPGITAKDSLMFQLAQYESEKNPGMKYIFDSTISNDNPDKLEDRQAIGAHYKKLDPWMF